MTPTTRKHPFGDEARRAEGGHIMSNSPSPETIAREIVELNSIHEPDDDTGLVTVNADTLIDAIASALSRLTQAGAGEAAIRADERERCAKTMEPEVLDEVAAEISNLPRYRVRADRLRDLANRQRAAIRSLPPLSQEPKDEGESARRLYRTGEDRPPPGCYCKPGKCMAPNVMGHQVACRDPAKAALPERGEG